MYYLMTKRVQDEEEIIELLTENGLKKRKKEFADLQLSYIEKEFNKNKEQINIFEKILERNITQNQRENLVSKVNKLKICNESLNLQKKTDLGKLYIMLNPITIKEISINDSKENNTFFLLSKKENDDKVIIGILSLLNLEKKLSEYIQAQKTINQNKIEDKKEEIENLEKRLELYFDEIKNIDNLQENPNDELLLKIGNILLIIEKYKKEIEILEKEDSTKLLKKYMTNKNIYMKQLKLID